MNIATVRHTLAGGYLINGAHFVPADPGNRDHRRVQDWIAAGNTPDPAETLAEKQARRAQEVKDLTRDAIHASLDETAQLNALRMRGDSGLSASDQTELDAISAWVSGVLVEGRAKAGEAASSADPDGIAPSFDAFPAITIQL